MKTKIDISFRDEAGKALKKAITTKEPLAAILDFIGHDLLAEFKIKDLIIVLDDLALYDYRIYIDDKIGWQNSPVLKDIHLYLKLK
jgi:hypothetical protein